MSNNMEGNGIRYVEAETILGETGDVHRFSSYSKLLAFAGLDPTIRQFGKFTVKKTRIRSISY